MRITRCKHPGCKGWASRSGNCPQHDEAARERVRHARYGERGLPRCA